MVAACPFQSISSSAFFAQIKHGVETWFGPRYSFAGADLVSEAHRVAPQTRLIKTVDLASHCARLADADSARVYPLGIQLGETKCRFDRAREVR